MASSSPSSYILDEDFLKGPDFDQWLEYLRTDLYSEQIGYVLATDCPTFFQQIFSNECEANQIIENWKNDNDRARSRIISSISGDLQVLVGGMSSCRQIVRFLRDYFNELRKPARYHISKALFGCEMKEGENVSEHVLKMIDMIDRLGRLDFPLDSHLQTDVILHSLPPSYSVFVADFYGSYLQCTTTELLDLLINFQEAMVAEHKGNNENCEDAASSSGSKKKKSKGKGKRLARMPFGPSTP